MAYTSNTDDDRRMMLKKIGAKDFAEVIAEIPKELQLDRLLDIEARSEMDLMRELEQLSSRRNALACFAGGGVYDHFVPSAVGAIVSRPEFMTAYTPYQAEVAQGTLQVIYEFQTHICRLTGMEVANASMYDGASAAAEACLISTAITKRNKVVVAETVSPLSRQVMDTYLSARGIEIVTVPMTDGLTEVAALKGALDDQTACVLISQPNFFGGLEDAPALVAAAHEVGTLAVMSVDPIAQALLKTPGECGADIVVGEGQPLGIPVSYGGPLLGFFAATKKLVRNMPGRIAARTKDADGKTGFVLTLQTREQHIRREKATSNICTNQALCATAAAVYVSLMGKTGLKQVALLSAEKAQKAYDAITKIEGFKPYFEGPFVREFAVKTPRPAGEIILELVEKGVLAGIDAGRWYTGLDDCLVVACTEKRTDDEIDALVNGLKEAARTGVLSTM